MLSCLKNVIVQKGAVTAIESIFVSLTAKSVETVKEELYIHAKTMKKTHRTTWLGLKTLLSLPLSENVPNLRDRLS